MSSPILDPSLPADSSPFVSSEMRGQFQAIQDRFDRPAGVAPLGLTVSNPLTQAVAATSSGLGGHGAGGRG
jgi:hypothetical protein